MTCNNRGLWYITVSVIVSHSLLTDVSQASVIVSHSLLTDVSQASVIVSHSLQTDVSPASVIVSLTYNDRDWWYIS
jgi:hypothetical protein